MPYPLLDSTDARTRHPAAHNKVVDLVAHFGAVGDGVTNNLAAFQAAVDALDDGTDISGTIIVPGPGNDFAVNGTVVIGDGTKYVALSIIGQEQFWGAIAPRLTTRVQQLDGTKDTFKVNFRNDHTGSFHWSGVNVLYPTSSTGKAFWLRGAANAPTFEKCTIRLAGIGIHMDNVGESGTATFGSVSAGLRDVTFRSCVTADTKWTGAHTVPYMERCYFQGSSASNGILIDTGGSLTGGLCASCVFEAKTAPDIMLNGGLVDHHFDSCWFEANTGNMIDIANSNMVQVVFTNVQISGSGGHFIHNSSTTRRAENITFVGGRVDVSSGSKKFFNVDTDPTSSGTAGFRNIHVIGMRRTGAADIKGLYPDSMDANQLSILNSPQYFDGTEIKLNGLETPNYIKFTGAGITEVIGT